MATSSPISPSPRRWMPRYSLRTGLVLVTLVCLFLGFVVRPALQQRSAVRQLQQAGFVIVYNCNRLPYSEIGNGAIETTTSRLNRCCYTREIRSRWPGWLIERWGIDFFHRPELVFVPYGHRRADIPHELPQKAFARLRELPFLAVGFVTIGESNAGDLESLAAFTQLKELTVTVGESYDRKRELSLAKFCALKHLFLSVENDGIKLVLPQELEDLDTSFGYDTRRCFTHEELTAIGKCTKLKSLDLGCGDDPSSIPSLSALNDLAELRELRIVGEIGAANLQPLARLPGLRHLWIDILTDSADDVRAILPQCNVEARIESSSNTAASIESPNDDS